MSMSSSLSSTMIGHGKSDADRHREVTQKFAQEAQTIQQVQYPDTVTKLSSGGNSSHNIITGQPAPQQQPVRETTQRKMVLEKEFLDRSTANLRSEYTINSRKKQFNRTSGAKAIVNDILTGKGADCKEPLFPQKPSHQQVLMITGKLKMPDANKIPPAIPKGRKWLGDDKGWEA